MFEYPINNDITLRLLTIADAPEVFALTDASRESLRQWLPWVDDTRQVSDSQAYIQFSVHQFAANNGFQAGVDYRGTLVGCIGLHSVDWANRHTSIGYWLGEHFRGRGIMTAAVHAVTSLAFSRYDLNRVEIRCAVGNAPSRAIPQRLGFTEEGTIRQAEWLYDHFVDHVVYGMLAAEWRARER